MCDGDYLRRVYYSKVYTRSLDRTSRTGILRENGYRGGSSSWLAGNIQVTTVRPGNSVGNGQPQTSATAGIKPRPGIFYRVEAFEQVWKKDVRLLCQDQNLQRQYAVPIIVSLWIKKTMKGWKRLFTSMFDKWDT